MGRRSNRNGYYPVDGRTACVTQRLLSFFRRQHVVDNTKKPVMCTHVWRTLKLPPVYKWSAFLPFSRDRGFRGKSRQIRHVIKPYP